MDKTAFSYYKDEKFSSETTLKVFQGSQALSGLTAYKPLDEKDYVSGVPYLPDNTKLVSDQVFVAKGVLFGEVNSAVLVVTSPNEPTYKVRGIFSTGSYLNTTSIRETGIKENETSNKLGTKFAEKLTQLQKTIGSELFNQLSFDQKLLMANTCGVIDLVEEFDISAIYNYITG